MFPIFHVRRAIVSGSFRFLNNIFHYLEEFTCLPAETTLTNPPVFIIGAPRTGSTLLYQVLINRFEFTHLTNFHCMFYGAVSFVEKWFGPSWEKGGVSKYNSEFGISQGRWAPSECGEFWYRWFRRNPPYTSSEDISDRKLDGLKRVIASLGNAGKRPILFKNMYCAFRLRPLVKAFPEALFIVIRRDTTLISRSLLAVRKRIYGNINTWWSMKPPEYNRLKDLSPQLQVTGQVKAIYNLIEREKIQLGSERFIEVEFDEFCKDVHGQLDRIKHFMEDRGITIREHGTVPKNFPLVKVDRELKHGPIFHKLKDYSKMGLSEILNAQQ